MEDFSITLFSLKFNTTLKINVHERENYILFDFLTIFNVSINTEAKLIKIDHRHKYDQELKTKSSNFILKYKDKFPVIHRLGAYFNRLDEDEWFFTLPPIEINTRERYKLERELSILNGFNFNLEHKEISDFLDSILENYEIENFNLTTQGKIKIGEPVKTKRTCRFCNLSMPLVSFKNEAHAISEALGNKKIILNEECDDCNAFFDENVERDFINYHGLSRTIHAIHNKDNKVPKLKGSNFEISNNPLSNLEIFYKDSSSFTDKPPKELVFETECIIKIQNIYKSLCKFALSVIDSKYIKNFEKTIFWLRNNIQATQLPKIAVCNSDGVFTKAPKIALYIRNNKDKKLPYLVGELRFACHIYVFIVPFSDQDDCNFLNENDHSVFREYFKRLIKHNKFKYIDLSDSKERTLVYHLKMEQLNKLAHFE